ncbi:MAG: polysaccharide biosynthesis tyrosine autokinase, partial [Eubacteriales bacterium]|nr:polysaccharide biosynthesis tyrosine autokinase [Eubacteriales bacterium]
NGEYFEQFSFFIRYFKNLPRMWPLVIIPVVVCVCISYLIANHNYVPMYTASTTFTVNIKNEQLISDQSAFYDNVAAEQMAQTFPYILTSNLLQRRVAADLGAPLTSSIDASVVENTNLLTLSVSDVDPQKAYDTLNAVIKNYPPISEPIVGKVTLNILDETGVPTTQDNPKIFRQEILKGFLIGLFIALMWTLLVFSINKTVTSENEIKKEFGLSTLGSMPRIKSKKRSSNINRYYLVTDSDMTQVLGESFRKTRNKIEYIAHQQKIKKILITSASAGEGKSMFSANLSISLAQAGNKVTLIDCDVRHPTGRMIFKIEPGCGLSDYLKGDLSLEDYIESSKTDILRKGENLTFFAGGTAVADGTSLLSSQRMDELIIFLEKESDYIILDSAPVGILTDSVVLSKNVDASILIIKNDYARVDIINDAIEHLCENDIQIIGAVFNTANN